MALDLCQNFVSAQYIENKRTEFAKLITAFILTRSGLELVPVIFSQICNKVMALD